MKQRADRENSMPSGARSPVILCTKTRKRMYASSRQLLMGQTHVRWKICYTLYGSNLIAFARSLVFWFSKRAICDACESCLSHGRNNLSFPFVSDFICVSVRFYVTPKMRKLEHWMGGKCYVVGLRWSFLGKSLLKLRKLICFFCQLYVDVRFPGILYFS